MTFPSLIRTSPGPREMTSSHLDCSSAPVPAAHACLCCGVTSVLPLEHKPPPPGGREVLGPSSDLRRERTFPLPPPSSRGRTVYRNVDLEPWRVRRHSPGDTTRRAGAQPHVAGSPRAHPHTPSCLSGAAWGTGELVPAWGGSLSSSRCGGLRKEQPACFGLEP